MRSETPQRSSAAGAVLGLVLVLGFVAVGTATLGSYGITWDEGLGDLYFGDLYLEFLKTGDRSFIPPATGAEARHPSHWSEPGQPDLAKSPYRVLPAHHWPVANVIVAVCGEIFDRRLHWLGPIEARHVGIVLLAALALAATWTFARELFGVPAAAASVLLLASFPEFFGLAHVLAKDVGVCAFYAWTIVAFYRAYTRRSAGWLALAAVFLGLALGTKLNAAVAAATVALWLLLTGFSRARAWWPRPPVKPALAFAAACAAGFLVFVAVWPWLWPDVAGRLREHLRAYSEVAAGGANSWQLYPFQETWARTPPVVLFLAGAGLLALVLWPRARAHRPGVLLLLLWLAVPLVRSAVPGFRNYDGIRRFLEFLPALMIIAGAAVGAIVDLVTRRLAEPLRTAVACLLVVLSAAQSIWIDARLHPHQTTYLNEWRGDLEPADYFGSSLRAGIEWINRNAVPRTDVVVPVASWIVEIVAPVWLRGDLRVAPEAISMMGAGPTPAAVSRPSPKQRVRYVLLLNRPFWSQWIRPPLLQYAREIHRIEVEGTPILSVFAVSPDGPKIDAR